MRNQAAGICIRNKLAFGLDVSTYDSLQDQRPPDEYKPVKGLQLPFRATFIDTEEGVALLASLVKESHVGIDSESRPMLYPGSRPPALL
jgi:hypothetical protein